MNRSPDRLYELLPAVHRMRDAAEGEPLRALLAVIAEQVEVVEGDIAQLCDNWFIETCEDWVVPYIGDLIGYAPVHEAGEVGAVDSPEGRLRNKKLNPRIELANTLRYRRRKGTLALLETLAQAVAGWPALAHEFYRRLAWAQHLNHLRPGRGRTLDLRDGDALDRLDGPFDRAAHTVDVRRINSRREPGRYNIPSIGVFVWRLKSYPVTHMPALCLENIGPQCFTFSILGNEVPLYTAGRQNAEPPHVADETNVPVPIRRRALEQRLEPKTDGGGKKTQRTQASETYYGADKSIAIYAPGWPRKGAEQPIPRANVIPADLSDWRYRAQRDQVALDPVLGRMVFPTGQRPGRVWVTYHYGFSADIGGGEYRRTLSQPAKSTLYPVNQDHPKAGGPKASGGAPHDKKKTTSINAAIDCWREDQREALKRKPPDNAPADVRQAWNEEWERLRAAVIEIEDNAVYSEQVAIELEEGESLQIRAAAGMSPVIRLLDRLSDRPDALTISGKRASRVKLDGLCIVGRSVYVSGPVIDSDQYKPDDDLCDITIRHCTLVPGWGLESNCDPKRPNEPSLEIFNSRATVRIEHSIVGSIYVAANEVVQDPVEILISDSIVDATRIELTAIGAPDLPLAFARLTIVRSTVIGAVRTHAFRLAENSIFVGTICVGRRQQGCMRFCYVSVGSETRTPRRYHCQPDLAIAALGEIIPKLSKDDMARRAERVLHHVQPRFNSLRYGMPTYCQLALDCAEEIARGADDESEMGVFHDLFQPQRTANLRARLDEYTPAGMDAGILFAT